MKTKVTKTAIRNCVKFKLSTSAVWAKKALISIYCLQTDDEVATQSTHSINGVGFTGADAEILTSFAQQLMKRGDLSEKQMNIVFRKMPKYWKQIVGLSDESKLKEIAAAHVAAA